jgi:aryl-alcohol dehydrogenase-like predicted oxidoreductase
VHRLDADTAVSRIGYGAMQLAGPGVWGRPDDPGDAVAVLREAVALGVNFLDTANAYGPRTVNQLIAAALHPYPDGLIVGNKVGADRGPDRSWLTDNRPETLRRQVYEALTDLRVEASELTYLRLGGDGQSALSDVPLEDSLGALVELRDQGLIRRIGLSGAGPGQLHRARAMTPIAAVENRYNLLDRSGVEVLTDCEVQGIAFVPYWPLAFGQLARHQELAAPARRLGGHPRPGRARLAAASFTSSRRHSGHHLGRAPAVRRRRRRPRPETDRRRGHRADRADRRVHGRVAPAHTIHPRRAQRPRRENGLGLS